MYHVVYIIKNEKCELYYYLFQYSKFSTVKRGILGVPYYGVLYFNFVLKKNQNSKQSPTKKNVIHVILQIILKRFSTECLPIFMQLGNFYATIIYMHFRYFTLSNLPTTTKI